MHVSNLTSLKIGGQSFKNQVAYYSKSNKYNLIGSELAKYFIVTLNFKDNELMLTPINTIIDEPLKTFGFDINLNEREIYVSRIYRGLNAEEKGIKLNDRVISVNEIPVDFSNLCDSFFTMRKAFRESDILKLVIERDGKKIIVDLQKTKI